MRSRTRSTAVAAALAGLIAGLLNACSTAPTPAGGALDPIAAAAQVAQGAEHRLQELGLASDVTVVPRFTQQQFLITADVTFPANLHGDALARAAAGVRPALLADDTLTPSQTLRVDSLAFTAAASADASARWSGASVGPSSDTEARLWAGMVDALSVGLSVPTVHVWHDDGKPLTIDALDASVDSPVTGSDLYATVLGLVDAAAVDPRTAVITTWGQYAVSTTDRARLSGAVLAAVEALYGLPFIGDVKVEADAADVRVEASLADVPGSTDPLPWSADERSEVRLALEDAALPTAGVAVTVVRTSDESIPVWPLSR